MKTLTIREIEDLLQNVEPEAIRQEYGDRLDASGLELLCEEEEDLRMANQLNQLGARFQAAVPPPPPLPQQVLPQQPDLMPSAKEPWLRRSIQLPNFIAVLAAALYLALLLPYLWERFPVGQSNNASHYLQTRGTKSDKARSQNEELFKLWKKAGGLFHDMAREENDKILFKRALTEYQKAHQLKPDDPFILRELARIYERLNMKRKRNQCIKKLEALDQP